jgi:hypothetical protein
VAFELIGPEVGDVAVFPLYTDIGVAALDAGWGDGGYFAVYVGVDVGVPANPVAGL